MQLYNPSSTDVIYLPQNIRVDALETQTIADASWYHNSELQNYVNGCLRAGSLTVALLPVGWRSADDGSLEAGLTPSDEINLQKLGGGTNTDVVINYAAQVGECLVLDQVAAGYDGAVAGLLTIVEGVDPAIAHATSRAGVAHTKAVYSTNLSNTTDNDVTWTAVDFGVGGNDLSIAYTAPADDNQAHAATVVVNGGIAIVVTLGVDADGSTVNTTAAQVITLVNTDPVAGLLVQGANKTANNGTGLIAALVAAPLVGGVDPVNEVQTVTYALGPNAGTSTLTYSGQTTATPVPFGASATAFQAALVSLSNIAPADVVVTRAGDGNETAYAYTVTFGGALAGTNVDQLTSSATSLLPQADAPTTLLSLEVNGSIENALDDVPLKLAENTAVKVTLAGVTSRTGTLDVRLHVSE